MNKLVLYFVSFSIFAATGFGQISSVTNDEFEAKIQQAVAMLQQGKHAEAQKLCEEASVLRPTDGRSYGIAGLSHLQLWKLDEASTLLGKAVTLSPNHPYFHYYKASADRFRNQRAEGLISVRKAIELKPDFADAYLLLGDLLTDPAEREAAFRKAISLDPGQLQAYRFLGSQLEGKHKDLKAAEEVYRTAIEVDPDKMAGRFDLGRLLVKQGRLAEARVLWNERKADKDNTFPNFITVLERAEKFQSVKEDVRRFSQRC